MKILIINSNTNKSLTRQMHKCAQIVIRDSTSVQTICADWGVSSVEGNLDATIASQATLEKIIENKDDFDAFIIGCFSDPGLYSAREILAKPVYGIAESSMHAASFFGYKFGILSPLHRIKPILEDKVDKYGLTKKCAAIQTVDINVTETFKKQKHILSEYIDEGKKAINKGAEVLILGGAVFAGLENEIKKELKVPVIEGLSVSLKFSEAFYDLGIKTSKVNLFSLPNPKNTKGCKDIFNLIYEKEKL